MEQVTLSEPTASSSNSEISSKINITADLIKLQTEGRPLTNQELKELSARVKTFEEMARIEDRLRLLENRKRTSEVIEDHQPDPSMPRYSLPLPGSSSITSSQASLIQPSIKQDNPSNSFNIITY